MVNAAPELPAANTPALVAAVMSDLRRNGCETWLCGGWAEELYGWASPRGHRDIDLVLLAAGFGALDAYLRRSAEVVEIAAKRFRHERAFEIDGVMVEVLLVERDTEGMYTDFWGRDRYSWPHDLLEGLGIPVRTISKAGLAAFRRGWHECAGGPLAPARAARRPKDSSAP